MNKKELITRLRKTAARMEETCKRFKRTVDDLERQDIKQSEEAFNCTLAEYIDRKRSSYGDQMRDMVLFSSSMYDKKINIEDSGHEGIEYFRDVPIDEFILIPASRLSKYRFLSKKSISVLKKMVLEDGGLPHYSW